MLKRILVVMVGATLLFAGNAFAVEGVCSNCHTMHNSQDGAIMNYGTDTTANSMLLRGEGCIGCHASASAGVSGAPQVNADDMAAANAGGSFFWVDVATQTALTSSYGHNIAAMTGVDATLSTVPGFTTAADAGRAVDGWNPQTNQLTCAGVYGCHGTNSSVSELDAVRGAHHGNLGNDGTTLLTTGGNVGSSFRFLAGIGGVESDTYPQTLGDHNVYLGSTAGAGATDVDGTISALCATCHGAYHSMSSEIGTGTSLWTRHPTDINMAALTGEYAGYNFTNSYLETPIATTADIDSNNDGTGYSDKIVTCLSCHFAHGSDEPDLLRFNYASAAAGTGSGGCLNCHTAK